VVDDVELVFFDQPGRGAARAEPARAATTKKESCISVVANVNGCQTRRMLVRTRTSET
jgi:hypothetical protein